jgi:transcriptional regulator with XRE-family HTH domain
MSTRLGKMLHLYRSVREQTLREVAAEIGIGHATLMRIEHGEVFDMETFWGQRRHLNGRTHRNREEHELDHVRA